MQGSKTIRVMTVDDHPMIRDGLAMAIQSQSDMEVVGEARNGVEAIELFRKLQPDITLMDLQMPDMNGIDAIATIRQDYPNARIIVLTTYSGDIQAARALKAGASGYLLKSMIRADLLDTIRRVHAGQRRIQQEIATEMAAHVDADRLTERELGVIRLVADGNSNKQVASVLGISEDTVKGHMKNILSKLEANDRTHAVLIAMKRGFLDS